MTFINQKSFAIFSQSDNNDELNHNTNLFVIFSQNQFTNSRSKKNSILL